MTEHKGTDYVVMSLENYEELKAEVRKIRQALKIIKTYNGTIQVQMEDDVAYELGRKLFDNSEYVETHIAKKVEDIYGMNMTIAEPIPTEEDKEVE